MILWGPGYGAGCGEASPELVGCFRRVMELASAHLIFKPSGEFPVVICGGPNLAEEVRGVDVAVFLEEIPVAAAAEHEIGIKFAAKFGTGFGEDPRQVGHAREFVAKRRDLVAGESLVAGGGVLRDQEIITADRSNQQGGGGRRLTVFAEILDEIEKLAGLVSDLDEEREVCRCVVGFKIHVSALICGHAAIEEREKGVVPVHAGGDRPRDEAWQVERRAKGEVNCRLIPEARA